MKQNNLELLHKYQKIDSLEYLKTTFNLFIDSHISSKIRSCALLHSNQYFITGSEDSKLIIWSISNLLKVGELPGVTDVCWCLSISTDDKFLIAGTKDG